MPNQILTDGDWSQASATGAERPQSPISTINANYIIEQDYIVNADNFSPLALNTPHATKPSYKLVAETQPQDIGSGAVRFTRTYAQVPATHDAWSTTAYNFIGFWGYRVPIISANVGFTTYNYAAGVPIGRERVLDPANVRIQNDYFLIGTGGTYASAGSIPLIQSQKYREKISGFSYWTDVDLLVDSGISGGPFPTTPTRSTYNTWIENARNLGWNSGRVIYDWIPGGGSPSLVDTSDPSPGQLCIRDSEISPWMGNIYVRRTSFVLAK